MERKFSVNTLASVGREFLLLAALTSIPSFALDEVCSPTVDSNPVPAVEGQVNKIDCAAKGGFQNSCAYQEWAKGRFKDSIAKTAKEYTEKVSKLVDPECDPAKNKQAACFNKDSAELEIVQGFGDPKFVEYFSKVSEYYADDKRVLQAQKTLNLGPDQVKRFERIRGNMRRADKYGTLSSALILLNGVDASGKSFSTSDKKKLIQKLTEDAFTFKASNLEGCDSVSAKIVYRSDNLNYFGKPSKSSNPAFEASEKKDAERKSNEAAQQFRTLDGIMKSGKSCGNAFSSPRTRIAVIQQECSVNLPTKIFKDNEAALDAGTQAAMLAALESDTCYKAGMDAKLPISKIAIATSASTLHNTKNFCKWDFASLSDERSKSIRGALRSKLGEQLKGTEFDMNSSGSRGDGSSGECAYEAQEWKSEAAAPKGSTVYQTKDAEGINHFFTESKRSAYSSPQGEAKLDVNKFARVTIYFGEKADAIPSNDRQQSSSTNCRIVDYSCN